MKAKEFIIENKTGDAPKPRNFVAKNAMKTTSGAGAHKDKKRAEKQGDVKHKKQAVPMEGVVAEKAVSKQQQKFMGMVHAAKKGETPASPEVAKVAAGMSKKAAKDFAATKHKGLPKKKGVSEVSKSTIDRYVAKASDAHGDADFKARMSKNDPDKRSYHVDQKKTAEKRRQGISRALDRMSREEGVGEAKRPDREMPATDLRVGDRVVADTSKENYPGGHKQRVGIVTRVGQKGVHIRTDDNDEPEWHPYKIVKKVGVDEDQKIAELSSELMARYKKGASADATAADQRGDYKQGDKRFSGIVKATKKQFANDLKGKK